MESRAVRDLMLSLDEYATVDADCTLREALVALDKAQLGLTYDRHHHRAVLVLDRRRDVIGKLTHWAILRSLEPELLGRAEVETLQRAGLRPSLIDSIRRDVAPFRGNLARMSREAGRVRVRDAMVAMGESIDGDASLGEAIRQMVLQHAQSLLVTRQGTVVGILRLSDVFEEVAERIRDDAG